MLLLSFYVPESHLETVKSALFHVGAGTIGRYAQCAWQVKGEGQFIPLNGSDPFIGEVNQLTPVVEYKVEMVCAEDLIQVAIEALMQAHPYETSVYAVTRVEQM